MSPSQENSPNLSGLRSALPPAFKHARGQILPRIHSRAHSGLVKLFAKMKQVRVPPVYRAVSSHVIVGCVFEAPDRAIEITQPQLAQWEINEHDLFETARINLRRKVKHPFEEVADGVFRAHGDSGYDGARVLLADQLNELDLFGAPVAVVPSPATLLITGSDDEEGLVELARLAAIDLQVPQPTSGVAMRLRNGSWSSYLPAHDSPAYRPLHELYVESIRRDYASQRELLEDLFRKAGKELMVTACSTARDTDTDELFSYCLWSQGTRALLPRTDRISLMPAEGVPFMADWRRVREVAGSLLEQLDGMFPPRYQVREFPTQEQIAQLRDGLRTARG